MLNEDFLDYVKQQDIKCGLGWYGLILYILSGIKHCNDNNQEVLNKIICFEEKKGELDIVVPKGYPDFITKAINRSRESSKIICEYCGCIGELQRYNDGSYKTLCSKCRKNYKRKKENIASNDILDYMGKQSTIHCGYGLYGLVMPIVVVAFEYNKANPDNPYKPLFEAKEGKLYLGQGRAPACLEEIIHRAQDASGKICERCGCRGKLQKCNDGFHRTLCPACKNKEYAEMNAIVASNRKLSFMKLYGGYNIAGDN